MASPGVFVCLSMVLFGGLLVVGKPLTHDLSHAVRALEDHVISLNRNVTSGLRKHSGKRHPLLFDWTTSCGECDPELCEDVPLNCPSGLIRDACDCCYVCGNLEDTACDTPGQVFRFGECGKGLVCKPVSPEQRGLGESDAYCACADNTAICGSDGRTYSNPCRFRRASGRKRELRNLHKGPCLAAPLVEIPPMNQTAEAGTTAVFSCSVSGFPLAWFEWRLNGETVFQPGLSDDVVVQIRTGPLKYQVTTWLEIGKVRSTQSGVYQCIAENEFGVANASARLEVIPGDHDIANYYIYRGNQYDFSESYHKNRKPNRKAYDSSYLRSHTVYGGSSAFLQVKASPTHQMSSQPDFDVTDHNDVSGDVSPEVNDLFVRTLHTMARPKTFKDVFFDDDDLSEGSGIN
uniref:Insulin-like growth factor-binding protein-related protein 1 n=1 Tax=Phallusia mammillata TaxID=59560 RepID=A0A6F9DEV4_9ASCI|nr:insulin-like growth factor-binding protein-related protein 1 [Phallusia mammillata]